LDRYLIDYYSESRPWEEIQKSRLQEELFGKRYVDNTYNSTVGDDAEDQQLLVEMRR